MIKIKLFCAAAMSTGILAQKMQKAGLERGLDITVEAFPESTLDAQTDDCTVALLGPQVGHMLTASKAICEPKGVPVDVISFMDYGLMNGEKVLDFALSLRSDT